MSWRQIQIFFLTVVLLFLKLVGKMIDLFHYIRCFPKFKNLLDYHISLNFNCTYFENMENSNGVVFYFFLRITLEEAENPSFCSLYISESAGRNKICMFSEVISLKKKISHFTLWTLWFVLCISCCFISKYSMPCRCGTMSLSVRLFTIQVNSKEVKLHCVLSSDLVTLLDVSDLGL